MLNIVNYFRKKLHLKYLTGFWICNDNDLKLGPETKKNRRDKKSSLKARWIFYLACKKYQATYYPVPKPGPLRKARTEQCYTFQGRGVNYAGHIFYCSTTRKDLKAYILLFSSSVSRAL